MAWSSVETITESSPPAQLTIWLLSSDNTSFGLRLRVACCEHVKFAIESIAWSWTILIASLYDCWFVWISKTKLDVHPGQLQALPVQNRDWNHYERIIQEENHRADLEHALVCCQIWWRPTYGDFLSLRMIIYLSINLWIDSKTTHRLQWVSLYLDSLRWSRLIIL